MEATGESFEEAVVRELEHLPDDALNPYSFQ